MATITQAQWKRYIARLRQINDKAAEEFRNTIIDKGGYGHIERQKLIDYAYGISTKYGEASAALSAEMYDAIAELSGVAVPSAIPVEVTYQDVAKTVNGIIKNTGSEDILAQGIGRLVKMAGTDTILSNAYRDRPRGKGSKRKHSGAQVAWIPSGDTCPFCLMLASKGWQNQTEWGANNHSEHIHANCDCTYAVRFNNSLNVEGYDPDALRKEYYEAGDNQNDRLNAMRREQYAENKDKINAQKRANYARNKARQGKKYPVTQEQIDDIISNELNGFEIIKHPTYNGRLRDQGKTTAELYPWGEVKQIKKIEIGPQSKDTKECLIDSIVHEELEAKIMLESGKSDFYKDLHEMSDADRHAYINSKIKELFESKGWDYGLV